jgi:hypothetical protein
MAREDKGEFRKNIRTGKILSAVTAISGFLLIYFADALGPYILSWSGSGVAFVGSIVMIGGLASLVYFQLKGRGELEE